MVLVRNVFRAKPGRITDVVAGFKAAQQQATELMGRTRILTDLSGPFNTLVVEFEVESLGEWERRRGAFFAAQTDEDQARFVELIESGYAEFYTIEA